MPAAAWRLIALPCVLLALLLVGVPDFPAFRRAVARLFPAAPFTTPAVAPRQRPMPATPEPGNMRKGQPSTSRGALVPLYASFAALQALDAHSTLRALGRGASEANPVMTRVARTPAALVAVKAGVAASTIYLAEKLRARSRAAAVVLMTALNSAYFTIVARNYRND